MHKWSLTCPVDFTVPKPEEEEEEGGWIPTSSSTTKKRESLFGKQLKHPPTGVGELESPISESGSPEIPMEILCSVLREGKESTQEVGIHHLLPLLGYTMYNQPRFGSVVGGVYKFCEGGSLRDRILCQSRLVGAEEKVEFK